MLKPITFDEFQRKRLSVAFVVFKYRRYFFISVIVIWKSVEDGLIIVCINCGT